jgi:L-ascorbate metabolism protein UlaG (beta-lactamase superfamily)
MKKRASRVIGYIFGTALLVSALGAQALELQWFGQSAFKITSAQGKVILIDPFISKNPKTPEKLKDLSKLGSVDLILLTHGHGDHIGDTVEIAKSTGAKVALNADMGHTFAAVGWLPYKQLIRFNKSGPIAPLGPGVTITMVRAEHSSAVVYTDPTTKVKTVYPGGEPCGYIIELEDGFKIYHAGDTGVFADMKFIGSYYRPDLSLLPIGGHFTMDPAHAAYAVRELLKSKMVMPMHYGTFPPLKGTPAQFKQALANFPTKVIVIEPGETRSFGR